MKFQNQTSMSEDFRIWSDEEIENNKATAACAEAVKQVLHDNEIEFDTIDYDVFNMPGELEITGLADLDKRGGYIAELIADETGFRSHVSDGCLVVDITEEYEDADGDVHYRVCRDYLEEEDLDESTKRDNKCVICGKEIEGYGNNAEPVKKGKCCDECNMTVVLPARIKNLKEDYDFDFIADMSREELEKEIDSIYDEANRNHNSDIIAIVEDPELFNEDDSTDEGYFEGVPTDRLKKVLIVLLKIKNGQTISHDELKSLTEDKKKEKSLGAFVKLNAGDPEKNAEIFNKNTTINTIGSEGAGEGMAEALEEETLSDLNDKIVVLGPEYRGADYPPFEVTAINEREIPDNMRFKMWNNEVAGENLIRFDWVTQEEFSDKDVKVFLKEFTRALKDLADHEEYDKPFNVDLEIVSRDGKEYGYYKGTIQIPDETIIEELLREKLIDIRENLLTIDFENDTDLLSMYDSINIAKDVKLEIARLIDQGRVEELKALIERLYSEATEPYDFEDQVDIDESIATKAGKRKIKSDRR